MIKKWNEYNESFFGFGKKEETSDLTPDKLSAKKTVYPDQQLRSVSDVQSSVKAKNPLVDARIDNSILQEISDRLYGPDSEEYIKAILDLNQKFRKREGKYGNQFYDPNIDAKRRAKEQEIINKFK